MQSSTLSPPDPVIALRKERSSRACADRDHLVALERSLGGLGTTPSVALRRFWRTPRTSRWQWPSAVPPGAAAGEAIARAGTPARLRSGYR